MGSWQANSRVIHEFRVSEIIITESGINNAHKPLTVVLIEKSLDLSPLVNALLLVIYLRFPCRNRYRDSSADISTFRTWIQGVFARSCPKILFPFLYTNLQELWSEASSLEVVDPRVVSIIHGSRFVISHLEGSNIQSENATGISW